MPLIIGGMVLRGHIQGRLARPDALERVAQLQREHPEMHRTELADRLCHEFGLVDARGAVRRASCLKALRTLAAREVLELPAPVARTGQPTPRRLPEGVPEPREVPSRVEEVGGLSLVPVENEREMRQWNELFLREHPRGAGPFVGRQLRYLIGSEHGWLGGFAFASAALQLRCRDRWIGWDLETKRRHLDRVIGLSRFLIRPSVQCHNLASHVLGRMIARLPEDFEERYGYLPYLVETFVDTSEHAGTCFRAANWIRVGTTQGRGRQDRERVHPEPVKDVYVYVLERDFRRRMGLDAQSGLGPLPAGVGLESDQWSQQEFGGAPLGDRRLAKRLVQSAMMQAENPGRSFPGVAQGDAAAVKGYYRFIDQPETSAVTVENILAPHREQTIRRMKAQTTKSVRGVVLCVQDGTDLNFNNLEECEGLGLIGRNHKKAESRGLHLHSTLAVSTSGLPLGVLRAQCWAPQARRDHDTRPWPKIPIEEKDTYVWIQGLRDCRAAAAEMPQVDLVSVMDREADFFELFDEWRSAKAQSTDPTVDLLVRARHDRLTGARKIWHGPRLLFDQVRSAAPSGEVEIYIGRQSARTKGRPQNIRPKRNERTAKCMLRYRHVHLRPPPNQAKKEPIPLWMVHVREETPPAETEPLEWFLLSTRPITSCEEAEECLAWYCLRWRIEDWHRVLKSGCKVEELQHKTAERLKRAIAINAVLAWRIMLMTLLGREQPDLPPEVLFSDIEIRVLKALAETRKDLKAPATLRDAVHTVAKLGGYLGRKNDGHAGHERMWIGYIVLQSMAAGFTLAYEKMEAPNHQVRGSPEYLE